MASLALLNLARSRSFCPLPLDGVLTMRFGANARIWRPPLLTPTPLDWFPIEAYEYAPTRSGVSFMPARIQHVSIPFPPGGQPAARTFYGELFGLREVPVPSTLNQEQLIWYRVGDTELHLFSEEPCEDNSARHFCFALDALDEVEALRQRLLEAGVSVKDVIAIPGRPRYVCRDPFNNLIEFTTIEYDYLS